MNTCSGVGRDWRSGTRAGHYWLRSRDQPGQHFLELKRSLLQLEEKGIGKGLVVSYCCPLSIP